MSNKRTLLMGTFILTTTGLLTRLIGFFFRIFLSHTFGEEQVGLYQLIFPIYALCFSLTCAGIETAICRYTARKVSLGKKEEAIQLLYIGLGLSVTLSVIAILVLQSYATDFSIYILGDIRCEPLLLAISYSLPFAAVHSCICGYYLGLKQTKIPAISQLLEQIVRVAAVYLIYLIALKQGGQINILFAVIGIVAGECSSSLFCLHCFKVHTKRQPLHFSLTQAMTLGKELVILSVPLTFSRILLNILQSVEAISIPLRLQTFGFTSSEALSNYGVLTGMALPCVMFPSAVTNSISTMLLPTVAEIQATKNDSKLKELVSKVFLSCISLGSICCLGLVLFGSFIGNLFFHSELAGAYLKTLAWLCPFLYLNSTLISITNGLGRAHISFVINVISLSIRITGVLVFIPQIGMNGYLWGLLISQFATFVLATSYLAFYLRKKV